jgi:flagellar motor switch protein FliG
MAESSESPVSSGEFSKLTKVQKLAILLVILGPEGAAQIMKNLDEHELEAVSSEMSKVGLISQDLQGEVLREFTDVAVQAGTAIRGGVEYTQNSLEKAIGVYKASNIINRISPTRTPVAAVQKVADLEARQIFNLIKQEQPQTVALIISYISPDKASDVLSFLPQEIRDQVVERLATMAPTPLDVVERVVEVITQKSGGGQTRALHQSGGIKSAAELLNALDKNLSKSLLISIEERNRELGQAIRAKMFTFEDIGRLESGALQKILREVDMRDLAVSLKTASEQLNGVLLGAISKRAAETVKEEMAFMGSLKLKDIEAAQMRIIEVVRRLETEGEIDLTETRESEQDAVAA